MLVGMTFFMLAQSYAREAANPRQAQVVMFTVENEHPSLPADEFWRDQIFTPSDADTPTSRDEGLGLQCCYAGGDCRLLANCPTGSTPVACPCSAY